MQGLRFAAAATVLTIVGCAKHPTTISVSVGADATVPPLLILRTAVASTTDPARTTEVDQTSLELGDAADRPAPFILPLRLPLTVDPSLAGPVTIDVEGVDWDSRAVTAKGSGRGEVVPEQETEATVVLSGTGALTGDGDHDP